MTEVGSNLDSAESRCKLLERQLEYMRRMVANAEQGRSDTIKRSLTAEQMKNQHEQQELRQQIDKIADLEREHLKLTATQTLAEVSLSIYIASYSCAKPFRFI